ncbi:MAG: hypothetical protein NVV68_06900 [Dokdonella sp.]|nr:hypothetical protein [Dokdonella sp.]
MSAATAPLAAPNASLSIDVADGLTLLVRTMGGGEVAASLFVKSELRPSLSYAVGPADRARVDEDEDEEDGRGVLWIGRAAFDVPPGAVSALRALLDAARCTGGAA